MNPEPDDRNRKINLPPALGRTLDGEHVNRTVEFMMAQGLDPNKRILDRYKMFMVLAWMAENDSAVQDVVLVSSKLDENRTAYFFAERLPGDVRFAHLYQEMKAQWEKAREEECRLRNKVAALEQQIANLEAGMD